MPRGVRNTTVIGSGELTPGGDIINEKKSEGNDSEVLDLLKTIVRGQETFDKRLGKLEQDQHDLKTGGADRFKRDAKPEDVAKFAEGRKGIDARMVKIVDETLGTDIGIELEPLGDRPGFLFTLVMPERLNDNVIDKRPVRDPEDPAKYKMGPGGQVLMEDYKLPDRRSRVLSTSDSFDAIRQHCEKVRSYIVAYYASRNRPMPELRVQ